MHIVTSTYNRDKYKQLRLNNTDGKLLMRDKKRVTKNNPIIATAAVFD